MNKLIYIASIDSYQGRNIYQEVRNDHIDVFNHHKIIGSQHPTTIRTQHFPITTSQHSQNKNTIEGNAVQQIIQFQKQKELAIQNALKCDVIVLDLRSVQSHESELILRAINQKAKSKEGLEKPLKVIGVSTHMTWVGGKSYQCEKEALSQADKQEKMGRILDQKCWKRVLQESEGYKRRVPSNLFTKNYQLENMVLNLNRFTNIQAYVLCAGLLYGRQNQELSELIEKNRQNQKIIVYGQGNNLIPSTNVQCLGLCVDFLIKNTCKEKYLIISDQNDQEFTQIQLVQATKKVFQSKSELLQKDILYISKNQCIFGCNLKVQTSKQLKQFSEKYSLKQYLNNGQIVKEYYDFNEISFKQAVIFEDTFTEDELKILQETLKSVSIKIITTQERENCFLTLFSAMMQDKNNQIANPNANKKDKKNSVLKPSSSQTQRNQHPESQKVMKETIELLLKNYQQQNFIIFLKTKHLANFQFKDYVTDERYIIGGEENNLNALQNCEDKLISFNSQEFQSYLEVKRWNERTTVQSQAKITQNTRLAQVFDTKDSSESKQMQKTDDKLILLHQYLLDNVLIFTAEAKFALKRQCQKESLQNFVEKLKSIYQAKKYKNILMSSSDKMNNVKA